MSVISVTRLRVRSWLYLPAFVFRSMLIARQAKKASGNLGVKLLQDRGNVFWTCTGWESEADMRTFMMAKPHGPTMRKLLEWCNEAALVHWTQPEAHLPSWTEAHQRLRQDGRRSKVNHPSPAQTRFEIAAPPLNAKSEIRFK